MMNEYQKNIFLGTMLGDGSLELNGKNPRLKIQD
jgi:hypothetical protein